MLKCFVVYCILLTLETSTFSQITKDADSKVSAIHSKKSYMYVRLLYVKQALNVRYKKYVKRIGRASYV